MSEPTLVRGADVLDGSGAAARRSDILIRDGRISAVEPAGRLLADASTTIDCTGLIVAPGFIDVHSHADNAPLLDDPDTSKILQGVTTEVVGNCGFSLAPWTIEHAADLDALTRRLFPRIPWDWASFAELFEVLDGRGYVTNYAPLVGHHPIRIAAMGMSDDAPDTDELSRMQELLDQALEAGVFGLSSGLIYPPGLFSRTHELVELARHLPPGRPYVTHMRNEGTRLLESIDEALVIGADAGCQVHISHLKASGTGNWGKVATALQALHTARAKGLEVRQDVYPYTAGSTMLTTTLPPWFQEGGASEVLRRLESAKDLERLRESLQVDDGTWENWVASCGWDRIVVASSDSHQYDGFSLSEVAHHEGQQPLDALVALLLREELHATMVIHAMDEGDLESALADEFTMIGSDGLPPGLGGKPHPRSYGTFPRVVGRYVTQLEQLSLPEAVRRMTSLPADTFGLVDRGRIAPGAAADLVAFDAAAFEDRATYEDPVNAPVGLDWVMTNGTVVVQQGEHSGRRCGVRLTPR